jgi:hypothetical protein
MKTPKLILPFIVSLTISAAAAPGSVGAPTAPTVGGNASAGLNQPNNPNPSNPNASQPPGAVPNNNVGNGVPGGAPANNANNVGNGKFAQPGFVSSNNVGNGTFIQPGSPAQLGSPVVGGQNIVSNNMTGQNTNALGIRQQYNQQAWMTNHPPLQTNTAHVQPWMTNAPPQ